MFVVGCLTKSYQKPYIIMQHGMVYLCDKQLGLKQHVIKIMVQFK